MNSYCIRSDNGLSWIEIIKMPPLFLIDFIVLLDRNGAEYLVTGVTYVLIGSGALKI